MRRFCRVRAALLIPAASLAVASNAVAVLVLILGKDPGRALLTCPPGRPRRNIGGSCARRHARTSRPCGVGDRRCRVRRRLGLRSGMAAGTDACRGLRRRRGRFADRFGRVRIRRRHRRSASIGLLHGVAAITAGGDQIVSGMALNLIAAGATPSLASAWFGQRGTTPPLPSRTRFGPITLPLAQSLSEVPLSGGLMPRLSAGTACRSILPG
jgi:hypothetical protein